MRPTKQPTSKTDLARIAPAQHDENDVAVARNPVLLREANGIDHGDPLGDQRLAPAATVLDALRLALPVRLAVLLGDLPRVVLEPPLGGDAVGGGARAPGVVQPAHPE